MQLFCTFSARLTGTSLEQGGHTVSKVLDAEKW